MNSIDISTMSFNELDTYNAMYQDLVNTIMKYVEMEEEKLNG